jgi:enolase-phosphatase E1
VLGALKHSQPHQHHVKTTGSRDTRHRRYYQRDELRCRPPFSYSAKHFAGWLAKHGDEPDTVAAVAQIRRLTGESATDTDRIVEVLQEWLAEDRKETPLKTLQGFIWQDGFASGELTAHFYDDVIPCLRAWHAAGLALYVFSSGSVTAQRSWFGHSPEGDLQPFLSGYFDTANAGPKQIADSYRAIARAIGTDSRNIVFLSDAVGELDAARAAGWRTVGVRRPGEPRYRAGVGDHLEVASFAALDLSGEDPSVMGH